MTVVADTGPLLYLRLIGQIELLRVLYGRVVIPGSVISELTAPQAPESLRIWAAALPEWASVGTSSSKSQLVEGLDPGEAETILIALDLASDLVLIDELKARKRAMQAGLRVSGTLGVLLLADKRGLLELERALDALESTSFYLTLGLREMVLAKRRR